MKKAYKYYLIRLSLPDALFPKYLKTHYKNRYECHMFLASILPSFLVSIMVCISFGVILPSPSIYQLLIGTHVMNKNVNGMISPNTIFPLVTTHYYNPAFALRYHNSLHNFHIALDTASNSSAEKLE
jgi:hypothetical protein